MIEQGGKDKNSVKKEIVRDSFIVAALFFALEFFARSNGFASSRELISFIAHSIKDTIKVKAKK